MKYFRMDARSWVNFRLIETVHIEPLTSAEMEKHNCGIMVEPLRYRVECWGPDDAEPVVHFVTERKKNDLEAFLTEGHL